MIINRININKEYKYTVTLPPYIICGKYNLYCTIKTDTEKLNVIVLPNTFSKLYKHHVHQSLSLFDNKLLNENNNFNIINKNVLCHN